MAENKPSNKKGFSLDQIPSALKRPLGPRVREGISISQKNITPPFMSETKPSNNKGFSLDPITTLPLLWRGLG